MVTDLLIGLSSIVIGYLAGSVSFSRVVTSLFAPEIDLKGTLVPVEGSEEKIHMSAISATSVRFNLGPRYGCLASFLDMVKVAVPVAVFRFLLPDSPADFLAATGAIIGHNWPIYYKFSGGYGHSAIYGALLVLEWTAVPVSFLGTAIFYLLFRQVHIAAVGGILLVIPWFWYFDAGPYALLYAVVCSSAYLIRVLPDFRAFREVEGRESRPADNPEGE